VKLKLDPPKSSEITPKLLYMDRRRFLAAAAGFGALGLSAEKIEELLSPPVHAYAETGYMPRRAPSARPARS
jgi:hypothetical protein